MKKYKIALWVGLLIPVLIYGLIAYCRLPGNLNRRDKIEITIRKGTSFTALVDSLSKKGMVRHRRLFALWAKGCGFDREVPSGKFKIPVGLTYPQLITYFRRTRPEFVAVTLVEGWSTPRILQRLSKQLQLRYGVLDSLSHDSLFLHSLKIPARDITGYLLPDTYVFASGIDEKEVLRFLVKKTEQLFEPDSIKQRMKALGLNRHQILTLASIVEGEALLDRERPIIASVYLNRLRIGMRLQADPTIQFLLPKGPRRLRYKDLKIESPYNTYLHKGLPPGPINNPGKKSILAVLFAPKTKYLYFVAQGDGSHFFARTAREHARAKQKLNRIRKKVYGY